MPRPGQPTPSPSTPRGFPKSAGPRSCLPAEIGGRLAAPFNTARRAAKRSGTASSPPSSPSSYERWSLELHRKAKRRLFESEKSMVSLIRSTRWVAYEHVLVCTSATSSREAASLSFAALTSVLERDAATQLLTS